MFKPDKYDSEEEKLKRYKARVNWASTDQKNFHDEGKNFWRYYENEARVYTKGGQQVTVPIAVKNVDAMFAALTAFQVAPVVAPKGATTTPQVRVMDQALKNEWDRCEVVKETRPAIKDGLVSGIGYAKVDYEFAQKDEELEDEEEISKRYEELATQKELDGEAYDPAKLEQEARTVKKTIVDGVTISYIPWDEILYDPESKRWKDCAWVNHQYEVPLESVIEDETIPAERKKNLKRDTTILTKWRMDKTANPSPEEERVVLNDLYDFETGYVCTFSLGHDKILKEIPIPFAGRYHLHKKNPFVPYIEREVWGKVPGMSDVKVMKPSIDEANINRSNLTTLIDRFKLKLWAERDSITESGKKALKSQEHGEVVEGEPNTEKPVPIQFPDLPQGAWAQDAKAQEDADSSVAINELLEGQLPIGRKSATGMNLMAQASTVRQSEKRNGLEEFYVGIADRMLYLMKLLYKEDRITRMVDAFDPNDVVWEWNSDDIDGDVSVTVAIEPREILDTDTKREKLVQLWQIAGVDPNINQLQLKTYLLLELGIPADIVRTLVKSPEQAAAEAVAQVESAQIMADAGTPSQTPYEGTAPSAPPPMGQ